MVTKFIFACEVLLTLMMVAQTLICFMIKHVFIQKWKDLRVEGRLTNVHEHKWENFVITELHMSRSSCYKIVGELAKISKINLDMIALLLFNWIPPSLWYWDFEFFEFFDSRVIVIGEMKSNKVEVKKIGELFTFGQV